MRALFSGGRPRLASRALAPVSSLWCLVQGSSAVAQDDDHRKLTAADPEVDGGAGGEDGGSPEFRTIVSAVTRLRPYTSLYIPHGPRNISRRTPAADAAVRRSLSMPQVSQSKSAHSALHPLAIGQTGCATEHILKFILGGHTDCIITYLK